MPLRVGVIGGGAAGNDATNGGGWTFTKMLLDALKDYPTRHQFINLDDIAFSETVETENDGFERLGRARTVLKSVNDAIQAGRSRGPAAAWLSFKNSGAEPPKRQPIEVAIEAVRPDIIWFMSPPGFPAQIPYIATVWDLEHRKQPYFPEVSTTGWIWNAREEAYRSILPRAAHVITGTEAGKAEIAQFYGVSNSNIKVIPFPAPPDLRLCTSGETSLPQDIDKKGDFLLYPAQYWPHKNHANLLKAVDILRQNNFCINLALTGSDKGNLDHIRGIISELKLGSQVFQLGFVSRDALTALYSKAFALVYPSFFGPDNLPPLEAFTLGCPVIAANVHGAREQLGSAALLFDPRDPSELATNILKLAKDNLCRQRLITEGKAIASERTPRAYISKLCEVLDEFEPVRRCWGERFEHG